MTVWLRSTESTMKDAAMLAARGEPHGTVVVAEEQTAGIGRHGHTWYSAGGGGLYLSIILRLPFPADVLPVLTMALGLAAQGAVAEVCGVECDIRWPNDLLSGGKKLAGIMVQAAERGALIAGIGVNVNQVAFPEDLQAIATSLLVETGREHSKEELLERVVAESLKYAALLADIGKSHILEMFRVRSSYVWGKAVEVDDGRRVFAGVTAGLDENGFLMVETASGIETVMAGGVRAAQGSIPRRLPAV
jgi:BirA family transcriptional regulator, biotin operon repressor / biotin---[acetyl-CoA-carboxylase] ligase